MKALMLAADGFEDSELLYPYYRLREEGIEVDIAAPAKASIMGKHGYTVEANMAFLDANPEEYDLLVLPGGKAPETVRLDKMAVSLTQVLFNAERPVAAICHGAQTLISAGVMRDRRATCWPGIRDDLKAAGADYVDEEVVVDENLITSRCPNDLPAFCREIFRVLKGKS